MGEPCIKEAEIATLIEANKNFKEFMRDMKDNHLASIYDQLNCIIKKMSNRRPSWTVCCIITILTTLCAVLITALLRR